MNAILSHARLARLLALGITLSCASCVTTYDRAGRPVQTVDPGAAAVGAVAAGVIGYAIANDNDGHRHRDYRPHHRGRYHCR